jgi:tetratricopeptide (TPR) repeat protein
MDNELPPPEAAPSATETAPPAMNPDRARMLGMLRDFRLLAAAFNADVPSWVQSLEGLIDPTHADTPEERRPLLSGDPLVDRPRILGLTRDLRLMSALFHGNTPAWVDSLEVLIDPGRSAAAPVVSSVPTPAPVARPTPTQTQPIESPPPAPTPYTQALESPPPVADDPAPSVTDTTPQGNTVAVEETTAQADGLTSGDAPTGEPPPRFFPRITQRLQAIRRGKTPATMPSINLEEADAAPPPPPAPAAPEPLPSFARVVPDEDDEDINLGALRPDAAPATIIIRNQEDLNRVVAVRPEQQPGLAQTYFRKGESYQRKRDFRRAIACFSEAIRLDPFFVNALLERGHIYRLARKPDRAIPDFNAALEIDSNNTEGYLRRGNALMDQGRHDEAIDDYTVAIALAPDNAVGYLNRALAHAKKQENGKVLEDASQALKIDPKLTLAYLLRGAAYSNRNSHETALADLNRAVQLEPQNALAYNERGLAQMRKGNYPQAILNYSRALAIAPALHVARFNRGLVQRLKGDYSLAIMEFTTFLERQPKVAEGYYQRGLAARATGAFSTALQDFDTALSLRPGHDEYTVARLETQQLAAEQGETPPAPTAAASTNAAAATAPASASANGKAPPVVAPPTSRGGKRNPYRPAAAAPATRRQTVTVTKMDLAERLQRMRVLGAVAAVAASIILVFYFAFSSSNAIAEVRSPSSAIPVQGTVLVRGKPAAGVRVCFHPQFDIGAMKFTPTGITNVEGKFSLGCAYPEDGAPPGEYAVTFQMMEVISDRSTGGVEVDVDLFHGKYSDPATSKWKVNLKEGTPLETFQLD